MSEHERPGRAARPVATWERACALARATYGTGGEVVVVAGWGLEDDTHWGVPVDVYAPGGGPNKQGTHLIPGGGTVLVAKADGALTLPASIPDWDRLDRMRHIGAWYDANHPSPHFADMQLEPVDPFEGVRFASDDD